MQGWRRLEAWQEPVARSESTSVDTGAPGTRNLCPALASAFSHGPGLPAPPPGLSGPGSSRPRQERGGVAGSPTGVTVCTGHLEPEAAPGHHAWKTKLPR